MNAEETIARTLAGIPWEHVSARAKEYCISEARKIIAALTEAGFNLTDEIEWEYVGEELTVRRFTDNPEVVEKWLARGIEVRRRHAAVPAGPWEPVPNEQEQ